MIRLANIWPRWAFVACALMLATAHAFETIGHMPPCELCLKQRDVYWLGMAVSGAGVALSFTRARAVATRVANIALTLVFLLSAAVAGYHAGVEWHFWPGPAECTGGVQGVSAADLSALLNGARSKAPDCSKPAWIFLGVSMAGWNALASLLYAGFSAAAVSRGRWPAPETPLPQ